MTVWHNTQGCPFSPFCLMTSVTFGTNPWLESQKKVQTVTELWIILEKLLGDWSNCHVHQFHSQEGEYPWPFQLYSVSFCCSPTTPTQARTKSVILSCIHLHHLRMVWVGKNPKEYLVPTPCHAPFTRPSCSANLSLSALGAEAAMASLKLFFLPFSSFCLLS